MYSIPIYIYTLYICTYIFLICIYKEYNYLYRLNTCKNYQDCVTSDKTFLKSTDKISHSSFCAPLCYVNTSLAGLELFWVTCASVWLFPLSLNCILLENRTLPYLHVFTTQHKERSRYSMNDDWTLITPNVSSQEQLIVFCIFKLYNYL